jgi:two-component system LytT family response regulator
LAELRVLTCDDEQLALNRLDRMLRGMDGVELVASCVDSGEAIAQIREQDPQIVFLDIEMPGLDGFDVAEELASTASAPIVVFVTAFSNFAAQAFEVGAVDFLLKPVRRARLEAALARARRTLAERSASDRLAELQRSLDGIRGAGAGAAVEPFHIWIPRRGELFRVDLNEVQLVQAEGEYVRLHVDGASHLHREPIGVLEAKLDERKFLRIHRSTIIRIDQVGSLKRSVHGGMLVRLATGEELSIGRKYARSARRRLLGGNV